ncbi:MAG: sodium-dependent transporter, partial [Candidatus Marinimicrobia bacterium]|nr:sodium-dependent transporter [Candidatus Neomarinimicrobiota bacterium]
EYVVKSISGAFIDQSTDQVTQQFVDFVSDPFRQVFWHAVFMGVTMLVVIGGVKAGIERSARILMPILFIIILVLVAVSLSTEGAGRAIKFLFRPNFSELSGAGFLEALGHAFFSLSLGMGAMITYGSYMNKKESIPNAALIVSLLDTVIAILACLIIFPIIMTFDLVPTKSAGILFTTLPVVFMQLPGGTYFSILFFTLVAFAALTSAISLLEVVASYFIDEMKWSRKKSTLITGGAIFVFGTFSALSNGAVGWLSNFNFWGRPATAGFFNTFDYLASNYLLPIGGLFIAIFTGWVLSKSLKEDELSSDKKTYFSYNVWHMLIKYFAPVAVGIIILAVLLGKEFQ